MPWQVYSVAVQPVAAAFLLALWPIGRRRLVVVVAGLVPLFLVLASLAPFTFRPVFPGLTGAIAAGLGLILLDLVRSFAGLGARLAAAFLAAVGGHWTYLNFALGAR